jgi:hypothetical protein
MSLDLRYFASDVDPVVLVSTPLISQHVFEMVNDSLEKWSLFRVMEKIT